ncbi:hypothetical protein LOZ12_005095 [Ophidiomyces ophidiicola]|uniref:Uncharacterized protein n=1 Tax=Ophidiomyces ophidiicola TaxID=1387563 RepID=A0ACB8UN84_9EURO|nr:hypothetical protein LOZ64_005408 [Ophidiomyces ophidiicola]KAI1938228.1 hypothetical protein LOZ62_005349 [Ophidiomyces ophidiicola]KAI1965665.1 hypothetical protein LOZ56_006025 [Ophidiomyces ophidiicola]KAI2002015.1 hypothetical protein LOZ50_005279 [Ophidiomyces ophidiicola]KAI2014804.1 hypothetical protein LOZ46_005419 [Ophidiomyces ophidiicola]
MAPFLRLLLGVSCCLVTIVSAISDVSSDTQTSCAGYRVVNAHDSGSILSLDLQLAGPPCGKHGEDSENLSLRVEYQTENRLHVMIHDSEKDRYQVPDSVLPRPGSRPGYNNTNSALRFSYNSDPFSFAIKRKGSREVLFNTDGYDLIFQRKYIRLQTSLPNNPYLYGLGEHSDSFRLNTTKYSRTLWNRDAFGLPSGTNLYGSHPVYFEHRANSGTHGVFLLNSNGMDINIDKTEDGKQYLQYNVIGGIIDLYFLAGSSPEKVASQYGEVVGMPAMMPYWALGFHQCRYGYRDAFEVAEVVYNYSQARIPLETMWTDIDYMDRRRVFTLDPERFSLKKMRVLVNHLHESNQRYIVMVDPAISYSDNGAFKRGSDKDIFLKSSNGTIYKGVVWPGVAAYPDWFHPRSQKYWNGEIDLFFDADIGVNVDGLWIDMNEAANFCDWPCDDPEGWARRNNIPPEPPEVRPNPRPLPSFPPVFQPPPSVPVASKNQKRPSPSVLRSFGSEYEIYNAAGALSNKTISTDVIHANGVTEYDAHNLYGTMMSTATRRALLHRQPTKRPFIVTRSTFAGAGAHVAHWFGDNLSTWDHYRLSIAQMLAFASIFQMPMVGSDVCGFAGTASEQLCARWAMLGAFNPFFRNHNDISSPGQEFYLWDSVAEAARKAIDIRYKLLDYLYTALHRQSETGKPVLNPLFYLYPKDEKTFSIDLQFFYGDAILVSPVTKENSTSVDIYLPDDIFYDYHTGALVRGEGEYLKLSNISTSSIPLHIRGGTIIPMRSKSANTTTDLRKQPFELFIAPGKDGNAFGNLYIDDGDSLFQKGILDIDFEYRDGLLKMNGKFNFELDAAVKIDTITVLGLSPPSNVLTPDGDQDSKKLVLKVDIPLTQSRSVSIGSGSVTYIST